MQLVAFLSKIDFQQQTLVELASSLLEHENSKYQMTSFMGYVSDER